MLAKPYKSRALGLALKFHIQDYPNDVVVAFDHESGCRKGKDL